MNFFENDYTRNATELFKEAFSFKKYKAMHPVLAVFTGVFMIPVVLIDLILALIVYVLGFTFNLMASPIKFLHDVLRSEGKDVKHATQFIIYWISWPFIFLAYALLSITVFMLNLIYALASIFAYVWTLGGFKFHVSVSGSWECAKEVNGRFFWLPLIYVIVCAVIVIAIPLTLTIIDCVDYGVVEARYFFEFLIFYCLRASAFSIPFSILYSSIALASRPKC